MSTLTTLLAGSALMCLASALHATDAPRDEGSAWISMADGTYSSTRLTGARVGEAMTTARPVPAGVVIFVHRGTLYVTQPYGDRTYGDYTY